jgi:bacillithiol biosynthesis cysteine-adding enzyme BshC
VDVRTLPWVRRLAADYAFDFDRLHSFFSGDPSDPSAWSAAIAAVEATERPRAAIRSMLRAQHERRGAPVEALAAVDRIADPQTVAVVTGQQAGLFGGPLFTILKALTAIRLAERVAREHDVTAVPVFWVDAEDHDWAEVRACGVLDAALALRSLEAPAPDGAGERSIGALTWTDAIAATVDELAAVLPDTEFSGWLQGLIAEAYAPGRSVADSFARLLDRILGPLGLVVFDSSDPAAKPFVADVFARELLHPGRTSLLAARAGAELVASGYHMQVTPNPDAVALFDVEAGRRLLRVRNGGFGVDDEAPVPAAALIDRARRAPQSFSPNVLLRPIVQDTIFPTVSYVAGPNELAYLAQLRGVYDAFGVPMPLMYPRATATLLDAAGMRFLSKHPVAFDSLQPQNEHALNELLRTLLPPSVERTIDEARREIRARMDAVIEAMPAVDPTLEGRARSVLGRMEHELSSLESKVLQAAKRRDETLRRQYLHVQAQAFPSGHAQERTVGFVAFLNRYGPALVSRLLEELPLDGGTHWVLTI